MKISIKTSVALLLASLVSLSCFAAERSEADLERDKSSHPKQVLKFAGVKQGDKVLDFLGGGGYYSQIIKAVVGTEGEVVLHTNQAYLSFVGEALKARTAQGGLNGVTQLVSEAGDLKLCNNRFDLAILVLGYHDFFFKQDGWDFPADTVMPELLAALKPGGKLLIIDHASLSGRGIQDVKTLHRIDEEFVKKDLQSRGFKLVKESDILRNASDSRKTSVFAKESRRKTDRFIQLYVKK
ncbi:MAG: class I SAM-dependent methyltransferase [Kangiellaceae bacterium]